jgi:hypothetical protein
VSPVSTVVRELALTSLGSLLFKQGPGDQAVEEVHAILRQIVGMVLNSPECSMLQRYIVLKREIATVAASSLEKVRNPHLFHVPANGQEGLYKHCTPMILCLVPCAFNHVPADCYAAVRVGLQLLNRIAAPCNMQTWYDALSMPVFTLVTLLQYKEEARQMVSQMVEMERSYLTAEVFREILASSHATDDLSEDAGARVSA